MTAPNVYSCGSICEGKNEDGSHAYELYYEFTDKTVVTADDVSVIVRTLRNKVLRFLCDGAFEDLQITNIAPSYSFKGCDAYFWDEVYKQCDFDKIVKHCYGAQAWHHNVEVSHSISNIKNHSGV